MNSRGHGRMGPTKRWNRAMTMIRSGAVFLGLLLAGCASFDQSDESDSRNVLLGKSLGVLLGRTFTISLPAVAEERTPAVAKESVARYLEIKRDPAAGVDIFQFKAVGVGETEIRISKGSTSSGPPDYVFSVKVVLGGSPY